MSYTRPSKFQPLPQKHVVFADACGQDLVEIRIIDEPIQRVGFIEKSPQFNSVHKLVRNKAGLYFLVPVEILRQSQSLRLDAYSPYYIEHLSPSPHKPTYLPQKSLFAAKPPTQKLEPAAPAPSRSNQKESHCVIM